MIKISELRDWLVDYITDTIHGLSSDDSREFTIWARSFKRDEADFVVNMEYIVDWGDEERTEISEEEAANYAQKLIQKIADVWYIQPAPPTYS